MSDYSTKTIQRPPREVIYEVEPDGKTTVTVIEYDPDDVVRIIKGAPVTLPEENPND